MKKAITRKLMCIITGDWSYCTAERMEQLRKKFGSMPKLIAGYMSREGAKMVAALVPEGLEGEALEEATAKAVEKAHKACLANPGKNKIFCILTGERMYISPARMARKMEVGECSEEEVRANYLSRVATRLEKSLPQKMFQKDLADLNKTELKAVHAEIKAMKEAGTLPAPSAPKGSVTPAPAKPAKPAKPVAETVVFDTTPDGEDIMRTIDGESSKDRKNRIRRERNAAKKAATA